MAKGNTKEVNDEVNESGTYNNSNHLCPRKLNTPDNEKPSKNIPEVSNSEQVQSKDKFLHAVDASKIFNPKLVINKPEKKTYRVNVSEVKQLPKNKNGLVLPFIQQSPNEISLRHSQSSCDKGGNTSPPSPEITMTVQVHSNNVGILKTRSGCEHSKLAKENEQEYLMIVKGNECVRMEATKAE